MPTPHNEARAGQIAQTVLMPGDPLRAKFIAENYLSGAVCYNTVRGMLGFTGTFEGIPVSVQGSGMGCPSIGIYSYELYAFYGVARIIRVGSAGGLAEGVGLRDLIAAMGACTTSNFAAQYRLPGAFAQMESWELFQAADRAAHNLNIPLRVGSVLTSDAFYDDSRSAAEWAKMNVLAVEMEAAALYSNAARANRQALCLLTVSDLIGRPDEELSALERQEGFDDMIRVALKTARRCAEEKDSHDA
jgi:purine-nucleoside phosphorylase